MAETVIDSGFFIYPGNRGSPPRATGADHEEYQKRSVFLRDHVESGGDLTTSGASLSVTLQALYAFLDGRQSVETAEGSFTFSLPASSTTYIFIKYDGSLVRDTDSTETTGVRMLLWEAITDATGVTSKTDKRVFAAFTELGLPDNGYFYLSTDRTKKMRYDSADGRVELEAQLALTDHLSILAGKEERFYDADGSNYVGFKAPALSANKIYVLPATDGSSGQALKTDGSGNLTFGDVGAPVDATYLTVTTNATLTGERTIAAGNGLTGSDGGAGAAYTLAVGAGTGITVAADSVAVDQSFSPAWTGSHDFVAGTLLLPRGTAPAQTAEGSIFWDTDDDLLTVGTASGRKTMVDLDSTQTLSGKTLTTPTIASFVNAGHTHQNAAGGGTLDAAAVAAGTLADARLPTSMAGKTFTSNVTLNTAGGTDAVFNEGGVDKASASSETFNFANSGAGTMEQQVDGNKVWHAGNDGVANSIPTTDGNNLVIQAVKLLTNIAQTGVSGGIWKSDADNNLYFSDGGATRKVWHDGNDGAGSGLDADTLDGLSSASFIQSGQAAGGDLEGTYPNPTVKAIHKGIYEKLRTSSGKVTEFGPKSGHIGDGVAGDTIAQPALMMRPGRVNDTVYGWMVAGTTYEMGVRFRWNDNSNVGSGTLMAVASAAAPVNITYYGGSHSTKPFDVEIAWRRESDGADFTTLLFDYSDGGEDFLEFIITVQGNSTLTDHRVFDLVIKRNGSQVFSQTGIRGYSGGSGIASSVYLHSIGNGGGSPNATIVGGPVWRVTLP